ncbi:MAG: hypothetical protein ACOYK8_10610 [Alphaproteobacteria bacterium]
MIAEVNVVAIINVTRQLLLEGLENQAISHQHVHVWAQDVMDALHGKRQESPHTMLETLGAWVGKTEEEVATALQQSHHQANKPSAHEFEKILQQKPSAIKSNQSALAANIPSF